MWNQSVEFATKLLHIIHTFVQGCLFILDLLEDFSKFTQNIESSGHGFV
jgi:hypothetical protein